VSKIRSIKVWIDNEENKNEVEEFIKHNLVEIPSDDKQKNLIICTNGSYGFKESALEVKPFDCDIQKNYNDDVPYDKIAELIKTEDEQLILLHGEPGTGKTSIIKKLIRDNPKIEFIYFDFNLLTSFSDSKIFDFLIEHKQQVFIIEDCEKLFIDRNNGNSFLNSMLNLTDGIIGEAFGVKFICTFNCPVNKIDKAVLREGRLSLIYEFKKLSLEKTKELLPTATEPMTLAEIYNTDDNGNKNKDKKIGF
jgi:SpoVK/Ycf46/Vps4 family AAA+-type ATPase